MQGVLAGVLPKIERPRGAGFLIRAACGAPGCEFEQLGGLEGEAAAEGRAAGLFEAALGLAIRGEAAEVHVARATIVIHPQVRERGVFFEAIGELLGGDLAPGAGVPVQQHRPLLPFLGLARAGSAALGICQIAEALLPGVVDEVIIRRAAAGGQQRGDEHEHQEQQEHGARPDDDEPRAMKPAEVVNPLGHGVGVSFRFRVLRTLRLGRRVSS